MGLLKAEPGACERMGALVLTDGAGFYSLCQPRSSPPEWAWKLPWNVQLALAVLEQQAGSGEPDPFMESWPSDAGPALSAAGADELNLASDRSLGPLADEAYIWVGEQYLIANEAAEEASPAAAFPSDEAFRGAMELVWSRCLRLSAGAHGVRRLLVPLLDLANHDAFPSAMYAYANSTTCGPAIRLHAARAMRPGDEVTITYGEHSATHFALYYGFVPEPNPTDALQLTLNDVLSVVPAEQLPAGGVAEALKMLAKDGEAARDITKGAAADMARDMIEVYRKQGNNKSRRLQWL